MEGLGDGVDMMACHDLTDGQAARLPCHAQRYTRVFLNTGKGVRGKAACVLPVSYCARDAQAMSAHIMSPPHFTISVGKPSLLKFLAPEVPISSSGGLTGAFASL